MSVRLLLSLGVLFLVSACGGQVSGSGSKGSGSGLYGTVFISPSEPVCQQGKPCGRPAADYRVAFTSGDKVVGTTKTDKQGRYRIALAPGRYAIGLPAARLATSITPRAVTVPSGRYAKLDFSVDVGIR